MAALESNRTDRRTFLQAGVGHSLSHGHHFCRRRPGCRREVVGAAQAAASAALRHEGFKVRTQTHATTEQSQVGVVLEQAPAGGARARKGATVTIAVGKLAPQTTTTTTTPPATTTTTTPPAPAAPTPE